MASKSLIRHQLFLPADLSRELERAAFKARAPKSAILAAAVRAYFDSQGEGRLEHAFATRLDQVSRQLARIERNSHILMESLSLFIRYMLVVNPPVADEDDAARAIGRDRFSAFVARVAQQLAGGKSSLAPGDEL